jgi:hypothetical protein
MVHAGLTRCQAADRRLVDVEQPRDCALRLAVIEEPRMN